MKKLLTAALLVTLFASSAFAKPTKVNFLAQKTFSGEFKKGSNVTWTITPNYVRATFVSDDQKMEAYYTQEGEKIGTAVAISLDELPLKAKKTFAKKYDGYEVKEAILFEGTEENAYFISAENALERVIVKVFENGEVSVYQKTKK